MIRAASIICSLRVTLISPQFSFLVQPDNFKISFKKKKTAFKVFLCPTSSVKPKDSTFTVINNKEKQQIFTFKKLETANIWHFLHGKWLEGFISLQNRRLAFCQQSILNSSETSDWLFSFLNSGWNRPSFFSSHTSQCLTWPGGRGRRGEETGAIQWNVT